MTAAIGWLATALFAGSYLFKRPESLRKVQALAAALWVCYGAIIHAMPVVVANLAVAGMALWSLLGPAGRRALARSRVRRGS
jgi:nitric oxide reductase large subunit